MTRFSIAIAAACVLFAQDRPKVLGVAHVAIYVKDLAKTRQFYEQYLGFGEPFTLPNKDGSGVRIAFVKINDNQYLELFTEPDRGEGQLNHISFYTDDADRMLAYLKSRGAPIQGNVEKVAKGMTGNKNFNVKDPDGHLVEIVEYQPDSWTSREKGKFLPATRIASHIPHLAVTSSHTGESKRFYTDILGFQEFLPDKLQPREGQNYLELSTQNHIALSVVSLPAALAELKKRSSAPVEIRAGRIALRDPDGMLVELVQGDN